MHKNKMVTKSAFLLVTSFGVVQATPRLNVKRYHTPSPYTTLDEALKDDCNKWPSVCPGTIPSRMKPTWAMNASTIIMPCNNTGFTDPESTKGWGIVDFDWTHKTGAGA